MSNPTSTEYEKYYVPEKSKMAVMATIGLILIYIRRRQHHE